MVTAVVHHERPIGLAHPIPGQRWTELRQAAVEYAARRWPVLPGTYQDSGRSDWLGKPGAMGLQPLTTLWANAATTDKTVAMRWWTERPYSVLLVCGTTVDVLEVPADHVARARRRLAAGGGVGPVVVTPFRSCLLLVRSGGELRPDLARHVRFHSKGAWIPLPPTARGELPYWWRVHPAACGWSLPGPLRVQEALHAELLPGADAIRNHNPTKGMSDVD